MPPQAGDQQGELGGEADERARCQREDAPARRQHQQHRERAGGHGQRGGRRDGEAFASVEHGGRHARQAVDQDDADDDVEQRGGQVELRWVEAGAEPAEDPTAAERDGDGQHGQRGDRRGQHAGHQPSARGFAVAREHADVGGNEAGGERVDDDADDERRHEHGDQKGVELVAGAEASGHEPILGKGGQLDDHGHGGQQGGAGQNAAVAGRGATRRLGGRVGNGRLAVEHGQADLRNTN